MMAHLPKKSPDAGLENKNPIEADIEVTDSKTNEIIARAKSNKATGEYLFTLPSGRDYGITVTAEEYFFHSEHIDIPESAPYFELFKDIELKKAEVGESVVLNFIFFDHDKATLKSESIAELEKAVGFMKQNPELLFEISGHTDNKGSWDYNMELSERRSEAVMNYFIERGVAKSRLVYSGYGYDKPIATNDTDNGRQQNRRVEMLIIQNTTDKTKIPVVFKVQVVASKTPISTSSKRLQGLEKIEEYYHKGMYKYAVGKASSLDEVQVLKESLKKRGYDQAFTVAFYDDTRIAMRTALKLLKQ
ncbi:MAG: OmpA family protein [Flavobacteriales bacterium]|nr:OmpA family protein [Flavobacteriales bacterium]